MFGSFLEGNVVQLDDIGGLCRRRIYASVFCGFLDEGRRETLYAQRALSMTGFTVASDMNRSVVSAGRKRVRIKGIATVFFFFEYPIP